VLCQYGLWHKDILHEREARIKMVMMNLLTGKKLKNRYEIILNRVIFIDFSEIAA